MKTLFILFSLAIGLQAAEPAADRWLSHWRRANPRWRGVQLALRDNAAAEKLEAEIPKLAKLGVNALVLEIDYNFAFQSHPELRLDHGITPEAARHLAQVCRQNGVRPIPLFNCLGHQSWSKVTFPLLAKHPEFDETPGKFPNNEGIYCRSWCPLHPEVNPVVFALIDELIDAFGADAFHTGMDEVFLIGSEFCPRCKGKDPATLFARALSDLHQHIVSGRKIEMLMWGDRLIDGKRTGYGKWEASENGTHLAIDLVPKDVIICDWHYELRTDYPSVLLFQEKGFRVWPSGWKNRQAIDAFIEYSRKNPTDRMLGYLSTTWGSVSVDKLADWPPLLEAMEKVRSQAGEPVTR